jgi:lactose/L-arabinose transport system substrate-binding protein
MKKTKLFVSAAAISMVAALSLTGCGGGGDKKEAESDNTITVWAWDVALKQLQASAEKFKETHPDVEFQFEEMGTEQIYTKLATTLNTGKGLADVILLEGEQVSGYASKYPDGFADLSDIVNKDDYLPVKMGEVTVNDKIVGFPWDAGPVALFYRTDYFEQAGVNPEDIKTWDDFIEAGKKVTATCKTPSGEPVKMLPIAPNGSNFWKLLLTEKGAGYFDAEGNTAVNSPESLECMEMAKKIYDADIALNYTDWAEYEGVVVNQSVATIPEAVWMIGTIKDKGPDQSGKWGVMSLPVFPGDEPSGSTNGGSDIVIPAASANVDIAKEFVQFAMTDVDLQADGFVNYGLFPSYIPAYDAEVFTEPDEFFGGQKIYETFIELGKKVPAVNYTENYNEAMKAAGSACAKVYLEGQDPKTVLEDLEKDLVSKFGK